MQLEIVKFYETSRDDERGQLIGTLHIKLPEIGLNVKGIHVMRKKAYWFIGLPSKKGYDKSLDTEVSYAVILFDEKEKNEELINFLRSEGRKFVESYLENNPQPIKPAKLAEQVKYETNKPERKETAPNAKKPVLPDTPPFKKISSIQWQDMPKKKDPSYGSYKNTRNR
jgi:hypothetical protein